MKLPIGRLLLGLLGVGFIANGIYGILTHPGDTHPARWAKWLVGAALAHDLVLAPAVAIIGWAVITFVPRPARKVVQGGLIVGGAVLAVGLVATFAPGKKNYPDNASLLPLPYGRNLAIVLGAVAMGTAVAAIVATVSARRREPRGKS